MEQEIREIEKQCSVEINWEPVKGLKQIKAKEYDFKGIDAAPKAVEALERAIELCKEKGLL